MRHFVRALQVLRPFSYVDGTAREARLRSSVPVESVQVSACRVLRPCAWHLPPDASAHVAATCSEDASRRARCDGDDCSVSKYSNNARKVLHTRVLMSLQHELGDTRVGIPELDTAVLGTTEHPVAVGRKGDAENKVLSRVRNVTHTHGKTAHLVAFECADALAAGAAAGGEAGRRGQLPHLDGLVQTATD
jgi:hypothetical protein